MTATEMPSHSVIAFGDSLWVKNDPSPWREPAWRRSGPDDMSNREVDELLATGAVVLRVGA
jgi:hypothetical protein